MERVRLLTIHTNHLMKQHPNADYEQTRMVVIMTYAFVSVFTNTSISELLEHLVSKYDEN